MTTDDVNHTNINRLQPSATDFRLELGQSYGYDVRVVEGGCGYRLLFEAPHAVVILCELRREQLERDLAVESLIFGQMNLAHAARADLLDQPMPGDVAGRGFRDPERLGLLVGNIFIWVVM
jgi:hypothetical protein